MFIQDFSQIELVIEKLKLIISAMKKYGIGEVDIQSIRQAAGEINAGLYHSSELKFMEKDYLMWNDLGRTVDELEKLIGMWELTISRRKGLQLDTEFWDIYEFFKYVKQDLIFEAVKNYFLRLPEGHREEYQTLPKRYTFLKGKLDFAEEDYSLLRIHVDMMADNIDKYKWLYMHLADFRSKMVLNGIVKYWFQFNISELYSLLENTFSDYYDLDILQCNENDVMVDLGAYTGDSIADYINIYGSYKKIYAYEITRNSYDICKKNLSGLPNVEMRRKGVGSKSGVMYINSSDDSAGNRVLEHGDEEIEIVSLDEDIQEPISVIKMDIEGAEQSAIIGAKEHIMNEKPRLLISAYHSPEDLFEIPILIDSLRDDYKYYLRFNGHGCAWPCDYVIFAV